MPVKGDSPGAAITSGPTGLLFAFKTEFEVSFLLLCQNKHFLQEIVSKKI